WTDRHYDLKLGGDYGWGSNSVTRSITSFAQNDSGRQDQRAGQFFADAGYKIASDRATIEPYADIASVSATTGAFTETGGITALRGGARTDTQTYGTLGMRASLAGVTLGDGIGLTTPHVDIAWQHAFDRIQPNQAMT